LNHNESERRDLSLRPLESQSFFGLTVPCG